MVEGEVVIEEEGVVMVTEEVEEECLAAEEGVSSSIESDRVALE